MTDATEQLPITAPTAEPRRTRKHPSGSRAHRRRARALGRGILALTSALALLCTGAGWQFLHAIDNGFTRVDALDPHSDDVVDAGGQLGDENFLIVGTDSRAGANADMGAGRADDIAGTRADTVMLITIPANRQRVVAVSFPRDLDVYRPSCQAWDNAAISYSDEAYPAADGAKLNSTYALGGPRCLVKVIQKISGIKIGHFIGIDFAGFETMVDQIGGVEVCTPNPLIDDILGPILPTAGRQTINGQTALDYVRARHVRTDVTSDYGRIKRQQRFLSSLLRSVMSNKVLFDPGKLNGLITAFGNQTFVEALTPKDLLTLGRSMQGVSAGAVTFVTVPTSGTNTAGNEIPRPRDIKALFSAIIDDTPLPGEQRATTAATAPPSDDAKAAPTIEPSRVTVRVSNATAIAGLASDTADDLATAGFVIHGIGNNTEHGSNTLIRYPPGQKAAATTLAATIPEATLQESSSTTTFIELILGTDYTGATAPTNESATAPTKPLIPADLSVTNAADDSCL
ncbi:LCP family protein [Nocardia fluminea]|uniref:LCP family protein n=1 Tax=Nocardia fluminea TaxID=134984 RepID=UPI003658841D